MMSLIIRKRFLIITALSVGLAGLLSSATFAKPSQDLKATSTSYNQTIDETEYLTAEVQLNSQTVLSLHSTGDQANAAARAEQIARNINALLAQNADWDKVTAGWADGKYRTAIGDQEIFTLLIPDSYFLHTPCKDLAAEYLGNIKKIVASAQTAEATTAKKPESPAGAIMAWLGAWFGKNIWLVSGGGLGLAVFMVFISFLVYLRRQAQLIKDLSAAIDQLERRIPQMTTQRTLPTLNPEEHRLTRYHQVLQLLKEGLSPVEISQKSGIGKGEIELICSLYEKQKNLPPGQKHTLQ